jgi:hypothetical protein
MAGPGTVDDVLRAIAGQAEQPKYIRAYHGSPYDWERPDMSMVGKGEGPLDEGFGLYATDSEGAANWYRRRTTQIRRQALADDLRQVRSGLRASPNDPQWHSKYHRAIRTAPDVHMQRRLLQREFPRGRTYELEIAYPRESLLGYDIPVHAQRPEVLAKMRDIDPQLVDELVEAGLGGMDQADGAWFYNALAGGTIFDSPTIRGQRRASEMLFEAGIPGHAYKNNNPNYVFYPGTEDQIRILRKYGLMAPVAAGAAQEQR